MNLGVLLLYCREGRTTTFTRDWAQRAIQRVADYVVAQSGGRETITFKVFDWIQLAQTEAQWSALGFGAYTTLRPSLEQKLGESLAPFTHILIGLDHSQATGGTTFGTAFGMVTHLAASNFTPSLIAHELGHGYGAADAYRETPAGPDIYKNQFCVMGALGWPAVFVDDTIADLTAPMLNQCGPNMCAPTLMATGWLKENEHGIALDLSGHNLSPSSVTTADLAALAGAPGPGWSRPPLVIRYQDLLIEYRVGVADGWDRGLPNAGQGAGGWVVVHRSPVGAPAALFVNAVGANPGAVLPLGQDNPVDIFHPGPLKISVVSFNAGAGTVRLHLSRRVAKQPPSGVTFGGVDVGAGGLVWTPGRGFTRVPPHSPLIVVLDELVTVQALQETLALASRDEVGPLSEELSRTLRTLQRSVSQLRAEPPVSPLAQALDRVSELHEASQRLDPSLEQNTTARQFLQASRQELEQVRLILATAVENERQQQ